MNIFLLIYLSGMSLKLVYNLADNEKRQDAVNNFTETVLWPVYLVFDVIMFIWELFS